MKELFQRIKMDAIISALCCIAFGIVLLLWPAEVTNLTCQVIGCVIAFLGLARTVSYLLHSQEKHGINLPLGLVLFFVGVWIFLKPQSIQSLLLIVIGVALAVHGLEDLKYALETKRGGYAYWWVILIFALLGMGLGVVCIVDCFGVISVTMTFVGVVLIYDGLTDLWIIFKVVQTAKAVKRGLDAVRAVEAEDVEVVEAEVVEAEAKAVEEREM